MRVCRSHDVTRLKFIYRRQRRWNLTLQLGSLPRTERLSRRERQLFGIYTYIYTFTFMCCVRAILSTYINIHNPILRVCVCTLIQKHSVATRMIRGRRCVTQREHNAHTTQSTVLITCHATYCVYFDSLLWWNNSNIRIIDHWQNKFWNHNSTWVYCKLCCVWQIKRNRVLCTWISSSDK